MKMKTSIKRAAICLTAIVVAAVGAATMVQAAAPALNGQLLIRPLTPSEITDYGLPASTEIASGVSAVGVGQPLYLDALVNAAIAPSDILSVNFVLTSRPVGSAAVLTASPLGANVPPFKIADRISNSGAPVSQVAGRTVLRPDITGQYKVVVTIVTGGSGSTNITLSISGSTYLGVQTCKFCHSGGLSAPNEYVPWTNTLHASFFTKAIDGLKSSHYSGSCIKCHTLGYDTTPSAVNGGFDDIATQLGWTFPATLTTGNWAAMPSALQNLANIQCENCHGPGSEHAYAFGNTNLDNWPRIGKTFTAGDCGQCHDAKPNHIKNAEWNNSLHARTTRVPSGPGRAACARCHTAGGFAQYAEALNDGTTYTTNNADTAYEAITCQTCHDPHDATNPHQLRLGTTVLLADGITTVTNAGLGAFCMNCHRSRNGSVSNSIVKYPLKQQTWAGGSSFGPHDNPASDMLEGVNGWTYGKVIPSSAHALSVSNTCVGCHMQTVASTDPAFLQAGGHTFSMTYTNGAGTRLDKVDVCVQCHGQITSFDMVKVDYNGDGVIEGVQTEVQHLLDKLSTLLPNSTYQSNPNNYVADGLVKSPSSQTNWPVRFLEGSYNWQLVDHDLSKGVHNAAYAVGLLKASIGDLTGDLNEDGLPDWWQVQYFGSVTNPLASFYATPANDGVPNWLKYQLGLNPTQPGAAIPGGFVWGPSLNNPQGTNAVAIYTAAEVVFDSVVGTTYQIQAISTLSGGTWQNVGGSIAGTGGAISYVTPTRNSPQQFFRVVHTP
jgi:hypothetical protein